MFFDEMKKTENSDIMHEDWKEYRGELTDIILNEIESYHIKKELIDNKRLRVSKDFVLKYVYEAGEKKPVLAIWGAGGCNDLDVERLSKHFRLVLIDNNMEILEGVINKYMLPEDTITLDLKFWDISDDDYRMFEALLSDGDIEEIKDYMQELSSQVPIYDFGVDSIFDYSVVVGLASQLNARFMALAQRYPDIDYKTMAGIIGEMNEKAVSMLWSCVDIMTRHLVIYGYEAYVLDKNPGDKEYFKNEVEFLTNRDHIIEDSQEKLSVGQLPTWIDQNYTNIMGCRELESIIKSEHYKCKTFKIMNCIDLIWDFNAIKKYLMLIVSLERPTL